jgi:hypothetical protein
MSKITYLSITRTFFQKDIAQLNDNIKLFLAVLKNTNDENYLANLEKGIEKMNNDIKDFQAKIKTRVTELQSQDFKSAQNAYGNFVTSFQQTEKIFTNAISEAKQFVDTKIKLGLSLENKIGESLLKLDDKVSKIPLEDIPESATINLLTTSYRIDGDKLYLKAVIGKKEPNEIDVKERTIEFIPINLYLIGWHSTIKPTLIFVDNLSISTKKQFQLAPSYSVLFKHGSRKKANFNEYFKFGLGVNMATLEFNNDNTPEIGIGLVVSNFKDYLQMGLGRNLAEDNWYWFFGLRLPFLGIDFNGGPKTEISNQ